ncbi:MAG: hypothetical protein HKO53_07290 [Gemmatimonadetes bacterium]|nr:hypothetical protein [Gemmatimonadota bacterium]
MWLKRAAQETKAVVGMTSPALNNTVRTGRARATGWVLMASSVMVVLYGVNAAGALVPELAEWSARLTNVEGRAKEGGIEIIEALLWASAALAFGYSAFKLFTRVPGSPFRSRVSGRFLWCAFFAGLSFMALGEETSWGQVYGWYSAPESVAAVNAQEEFNLHNLDVAEIWGLESDHPLVPYLKNLSHVINPIFYAFFLTAWVIVPFGLRRGRLRSRFWTGYPIPPVLVSRFFLYNVAAWLVVDRLFFDVGELFELSISITITMVAGFAAASWQEESEGVDRESQTDRPSLTKAAHHAILDDFNEAGVTGSGPASEGPTPDSNGATTGTIE